MAIIKTCFSQLCLLGEPEFVFRRDGIWYLDEIYTNEFFCALANAGTEWQRLLPWSPWGPHPEGMKSQFSPYVLIGDKFDLSHFNDFYFPIVKEVIRIAKKYAIKTWWCLADNCQFHGATKKWSPWVTNVNGIGSVYEKKAYPIFKRWIEKCYTEFTGLDVGWAFGNEMQNTAFRALAKEVIFPFIKTGILKPSNCAYGAVMEASPYVDGEYTNTSAGVLDLVKKDMGTQFGEAAQLAPWKEVHGVGDKDFPAVPNNLDQALYWWGRRPINIWLSDDGTFYGDSKCDVEVGTGKRRPSGSRWKKTVEIVKDYIGGNRKNDFVFEHVPKGGDLVCQCATMKEIYKAVHGEYPEEKWFYVPPQPPTPPTPPEPPSPPEPTPEKPCSYFLKHWNILAWLRCIFFGKH